MQIEQKLPHPSYLPGPSAITAVTRKPRENNQNIIVEHGSIQKSVPWRHMTESQAKEATPHLSKAHGTIRTTKTDSEEVWPGDRQQVIVQWRRGVSSGLSASGPQGCLERRRNHTLRVGLLLLLHQFLAGNLEVNGKTKLSRLLGKRGQL